MASTEPRLLKIGTRVRTAQGDGTVVAGTVWYNTKKDPGDRTVRMDKSGERLVFDRALMRVLPLVVARPWTLVEGDSVRVIPFSAHVIVAEMCEIGVWEVVSSRDKDTIIVNNGHRDIVVKRVEEGYSV